MKTTLAQNAQAHQPGAFVANKWWAVLLALAGAIAVSVPLVIPGTSVRWTTSGITLLTCLLFLLCLFSGALGRYLWHAPDAVLLALAGAVIVAGLGLGVFAHALGAGAHVARGFEISGIITAVSLQAASCKRSRW
jgi:hypothetical protein